MGYAQRRAAIVGVYTSEQARFMDRTGISLQLESIKGALDNDGGYAIVMAAEDIARDCRKAPVWVLGGAEAAYTDASWARARRTSPRATPGWAGRCRATPTAGCCRTATAPTRPVCTRSRWSASSGASAATGRFLTRGSASRWPRAWPCTVTPER